MLNILRRIAICAFSLALNIEQHDLFIKLTGFHFIQIHTAHFKLAFLSNLDPSYRCNKYKYYQRACQKIQRPHYNAIPR